ncbi:MAG: hypothetical protein AAF351_13090 [Pseudomonadota bacterium]
MRKIVADKVAQEVADWGHKGLIDNDLLEVLQARYQADVSVGRILTRWLGFVALFLLALAVLGFIGLSLGEAALYLAPFVLGGAGFWLWSLGTRFATDPLQTYAISGAVLVTFSFFAAFGALMLLLEIFDSGFERGAVAFMMGLTAVAAFFTAYQYRLRWPLCLGVLLVFHAMGHMHWTSGRGSYFMDIADERATFVVAVIVILIGIWHERHRETDLDNDTVGFGKVYIVLGLLYANMCLWFLSLPREETFWVLMFAAAGVAQLIIGGRLHDGRFTGFGIVFLSINIYTRVFETFWDQMHKGTLFLGAGVVALIAGFLMERRAKMLREAGES